jgi:hypothetical protein
METTIRIKFNGMDISLTTTILENENILDKSIELIETTINAIQDEKQVY